MLHVALHLHVVVRDEGRAGGSDDVEVVGGQTKDPPSLARRGNGGKAIL